MGNSAALQAVMESVREVVNKIGGSQPTTRVLKVTNDHRIVATKPKKSNLIKGDSVFIQRMEATTDASGNPIYCEFQTIAQGVVVKITDAAVIIGQLKTQDNYKPEPGDMVSKTLLQDR